MKIVDKETNVEVDNFWVFIKDISYRRDLKIINSTVVEYDREYFDENPVQIGYTFIEKGKVQERIFKVSSELLDIEFISRIFFRPHRFDVTPIMIEQVNNNKELPFKLVGKSLIVNLIIKEE